MSAYERSGWRDEDISRRHREWGFDCPAVDLDFLVAEYNSGKPVALIEYKHWRAARPKVLHPTYRALTALANGYEERGLPFGVVFYWPECWAFRVYPVNDQCREWFQDAELLTERQYVQRLYKMRGYVLADHLRNRLRDDLPMEVAA
jgi:hypothetical protein